MNITIRECQSEDYEQIAQLNKNEMGYDYPVKNTKKQLEKLLKDAQHKIFVATIDNNIVGYIHANNYDVLYAPHLKNIMGIAVAADYKRNGIGAMLLEKVEQWAKDTGLVVYGWFPAQHGLVLMPFIALADIPAVKSKRILKKYLRLS